MILFGSYVQEKKWQDSGIDVAIIVDKIQGYFFQHAPYYGGYEERLVTGLNQFFEKK